jgi:hypothetical protein
MCQGISFGTMQEQVLSHIQEIATRWTLSAGAVPVPAAGCIVPAGWSTCNAVHAVTYMYNIMMINHTFAS